MGYVRCEKFYMQWKKVKRCRLRKVAGLVRGACVECRRVSFALAACKSHTEAASLCGARLQALR